MRLNKLYYVIIFLCFSLNLYCQDDKIEKAIARYNKQLTLDNGKNKEHSKDIKKYAWDCYKLYREFYPEDFEARKTYLEELTEEFAGLDMDFNKNPYFPDKTFVDSCMLETNLTQELVYKIVAYSEYKYLRKELFEKLMSLCKRLDTFADPIVCEILSNGSRDKNIIFQYSNDILCAYEKCQVADEYYIPIYNILISNTNDRPQKLDYALLKLNLYKRIKGKTRDYDHSYSPYFKSLAKNFDRDYTYAVRDVFNFTPFDNYPLRIERLLHYGEAISEQNGKNSNEYGEILQQVSELYQQWCVSLGTSIRDINQDTWEAYKIYNGLYQAWLKDNGKFGTEDCNLAVREMIFVTKHYRKDESEALKCFWNYLGGVRDAFGEESHMYLQAIKQTGSNVIDKNILEKEERRVQIARLKKDDSDEAKIQLAELMAKEGTIEDKIETLQTIKSPTVMQLMQLASNEQQYGNTEGCIKYWKQVLDSCSVLSYGSDDNIRFADSFSISGLMQLQSIMQNTGYKSEWWSFAQSYIKGYNHNTPGFISALLNVASSCKGDYASFDYYSGKYEFTLNGDGTPGIELIDEFLTKLPNLKNDTETYAHILATKADLYCFNQDFQLSQQLYDESRNIIKGVKDISPFVSLQYEMYDEVLQAYRQDYATAREKAIKIKSKLEAIDCSDCIEYYFLLFRLEMYSYKLGDYEQTIEYGNILHNADVYQQRCAISQKFPFHFQGPQGNLNIYYDKQSDLVLVNSYYYKQNYNQAYALAKDLIEKTQKAIEENYSSFSRVKQANLLPWVEFLNTYTPLFAYRMPQYDWAQYSFDAALLYKQFSLNADNALRHIILRSDDERLIGKYKELSSTRQLFDNANSLELDSLSRRVSQLESQLLVDVKRYGDVGQQMQTHSADIRRELRNNEAAIEFVSCVEDDGQIHYMANIIAYGNLKNYYLCTEEELIKSTNPYTTDSGYNLLWLPLEEDLKGIDNIYFSPVGILHQIPIEYFAINNKGVLLSEKFNVHRVSSTREIVGKYPKNNTLTAVLYGGINYEVNTRKGDEAAIKTNVPEVAPIRGGYSYLPGTKDEVEYIEKELKKNKYEVELYQGNEGSEESFKSLSSHPIKYLHLATHGFFTPKGRRTKFDKLFKDVNRYSSLEDANMNRTGLLMAGASNSINGHPITGSEDGILTSKEISSLDFTHLELVVLSACETALGEMGSEGVYGLQRAFKKAGAHSMIMSLRKVDDNATKILMTSFYKNLSSMDKLSAFRLAIKDLREADEGAYGSPEYWTSFVIIDD